MTSVAIVGATGMVGREMLAVLESRKFPIRELRLLASERSKGGTIEALGGTHDVSLAAPDAFFGVDLALFSAGAEVSSALAPAARNAGALVVDNSSAFRMDPDTPLVVPELNGDALDSHSGIVANPNCSAILLCMALAPIHRAAGLERVIMCSYQAVSGAGAGAMEELRCQEEAEAKGVEPKAEIFPKVLSHNVLPWVHAFQQDGSTTEEAKVRDETRRVLEMPELPIGTTCVRVPVWRAHSQAIHVALERPLSPDEAARAYDGVPGVRVWHDGFPTPREAAGTDEVHIGRIRADHAFTPGVALWGVMDQLRKGAALNAIQIAERALGISVGT